MDQQPIFPTANDPLGETLHQLRLDGSLYCRSTLGGEWSLAMPALPGKMMFHIITEGECWLQIGEQPAQHLTEKSVVLIPHGSGHVISSNPQLQPVPLFDAGIKQISTRYETLDIQGDGPTTRLTCGVMSFDQIAGRQLINQLPPVLRVDRLEEHCENWLSSSLEFISCEARALKPGGETIITHLADILVIQLLRHWMEQPLQAGCGWVGALRDKHIGVALHAIHRHPEHPWTVDSLARECGLSRSGFSARFTQLVGKSAKHYLTEWRMQIAQQRLKHHSVPLIELAEELGYASEAAFSRAFKRVIGVSPGRV